MAWVTAIEVRKYAAVKRESMNFPSDASLDSFIEAYLIPRAQARINTYCRRDFDDDYGDDIPEDVEDVCARVVANMIQYIVMNKMGPLIRTGDYNISIPKQAVLTPELKEDLAAYVTKTNPSSTSSPSSEGSVST